MFKVRDVEMCGELQEVADGSGSQAGKFSES
jgi:hypothetical protein